VTKRKPLCPRLDPKQAFADHHNVPRRGEHHVGRLRRPQRRVCGEQAGDEPCAVVIDRVELSLLMSSIIELLLLSFIHCETTIAQWFTSNYIL
jgi:hypothetical protein